MNRMLGDCAWIEPQLSEYLDGELRGLHRLRVRAHLWRCERCRPVFESLARTVAGLRSLATLEPPR
jgi:predicted anti-sigma-YlaC factor YlaD